MKYAQAKQIKQLVDGAKDILIIQADNPDADSLGSALALEQIIGDMNKEPYLYCGVDIPDYLKHLSGWDRVNKDMPSKFDLSIIVDTSALALLEKLAKSDYQHWVASKPVVVLDHHSDVKCDIPYASIVLNDNDAVATGEVIYKLAQELKWSLNLQAKTHIASSILSDSLGLSSEGTTPTTYRIMADLIESGVDRPALEEARRAYMKMPEKVFRYKAELINRTELVADGQLAIVSVPYEEIVEYSPLYNPAALIHNDMLLIDGVLAAIVLKIYNDGKITGAFRANHNGTIGDALAKRFGGGGHIYSSGFKITDGRGINDIKSEVIEIATDLLAKLEDKS